MPRPEPVPQKVVCSLCGLPWDDHGFSDQEPDAAVCVKLLVAELEEARRPKVGDTLEPYPRSVPLPNWPVMYPTVTYGTGTATDPIRLPLDQAATAACVAFMENRSFEERMNALLNGPWVLPSDPDDDDDDGTAGVPALVR